MTHSGKERRKENGFGKYPLNGTRNQEQYDCPTNAASDGGYWDINAALSTRQSGAAFQGALAASRGLLVQIQSEVDSRQSLAYGFLSDCANRMVCAAHSCFEHH